MKGVYGFVVISSNRRCGSRRAGKKFAGENSTPGTS
jgi:hypothetical protein